MDITKCVIPAAGLGTRFLPFTKIIPKEMLPLLNKPAIQYIIEEGMQSALENFILITGKGKNAISDHFDNSFELESILRERNKIDLIAKIDSINKNAAFSYVRQSEPLGLGHAILLARHGIGKEYFGIFLPDDIIMGKTPAMSQLIRIARQEKSSVIAVQEVPMDCVSSYGIINVKKQITPNLFQVSNMVEKPSQKDAPSNLAVIGRYVLSHKIFPALTELSPYAVGELQLTDAISHMIYNNEKVFAYKVQGTRYDIGTPIGWLKATIGLSLQDPHYGPHLRKYLKDLETIDSFIYDTTKNIEHSI
ncbi:UTP--glucose-1-phosphate uridylyltransferase GalU [bacterium]|jgi:UTP--glucose-1-phosphate uridylyltransferase|nr:UTP--glucose-1-phosphate uridylyltransferase GalU [bacterium]